MSETIHPASSSQAVAARFAIIIDLMCKAVGCRRGPKGGPEPIGLYGLKVERLPDSLVMSVWNMLRRILKRFTYAITNPPKPYRSRASRADQPRPAKSPDDLPRHYAWLLRLVQETAGGAERLRHFINDPEIAALIAADPRLGRILRPLCAMLGMPHNYTPLLWQPPAYQKQTRSRQKSPAQPPDAQASPQPSDAQAATPATPNKAAPPAEQTALNPPPSPASAPPDNPVSGPAPPAAKIDLPKIDLPKTDLPE